MEEFFFVACQYVFVNTCFQVFIVGDDKKVSGNLKRIILFPIFGSASRQCFYSPLLVL